MKRFGLTVEVLGLFGTLIFYVSPAMAEMPEISGSSASSAVSAVASDSATVVEPFLWPLSPMIGGKKTMVLSGFGKRQVPQNLWPLPTAKGPVFTGVEDHKAVDFIAAESAVVRASRAGKVLFIGFSKEYVSRKDKNDKWRAVIIRHADGMSTRYVHLNAVHVAPGQQVTAGQVIGRVASSDEWTDPVFHFEIRDAKGVALNPMDLLQVEGAHP